MSPAPALAAVSVALAAIAVVSAAPAAAAAPAELPSIAINEVATDDDWIELVNTGSLPVDLGGYIVKDDNDERTLVIAAGTVLAPGAFVAIDTDVDGGFGLGKADAARLFLPGGVTVVDQYAWAQHPFVSYGRCPDGIGDFVQTDAATKAAVNDCIIDEVDEPDGPVRPAPEGVVVNEVESNGDDTDWAELFNTTDADIDLSGTRFRDNDVTRTPYVLPEGSIIPAGGFFVIDQETATQPGFDFGLGDDDEVNLFGEDGTTIVAAHAWSGHAAVSYGRCPDGTGELRDTTTSTKGAPNDCSLPVRINEIESSGGEPGDWIELRSIGSTSIDLGGLVVTDSDPEHTYEIPIGTVVEPGALLVIEEAQLGFGLGGADAARLLSGADLVDAYTWTEHAATTLGRCPDGTGGFAVTETSTKGAPNRCVGILTPEAWPGGADVTTIDAAGDYEGDLSGVDVDGDVLWVVENGNGILHRLVASGDGWVQDTGWEDGRTLRYPSGGGTVDAEGVTATPGGTLFVSSERDNDSGSVSRPAVLEYDTSGAGELIASREWNLAEDFPGLAANGGLEGITFVPDAFLVERGFVDQRSGAPYAPATLPAHGDGLFFVGVEGTASVYAYALMTDGTFTRIATIATPFELVADVQFDAARAALWVVCDEACDGQIATYEIAEDGTFAATALYERPGGMANVANEGFAIGSTCTNGRAATFYADDADTDGFSLRSGTIDCARGDEGGGTDPGDGGSGDGGSGDGGAGEAEPVDEGELTDDARGGMVAPASAAPGERIELRLPSAAEERVNVWLHSDPQLLATPVVGAEGSFAVVIPTDVAAGAHRIVVTDASGALLAWAPLQIVAGSEAALAVTGGSAPFGAAVLAGLAVAGGLLLVGRRRARVG